MTCFSRARIVLMVMWIASVSHAQTDDADLNNVDDVTLDSADEARKPASPPPSDSAVTAPEALPSSPAAEVVPPSPGAAEVAAPAPAAAAESAVPEATSDAPAESQVTEPAPVADAAPSAPEEEVKDVKEEETAPIVDRFKLHRKFGRSRVQVSMNRPKFDEGQKHYGELYGTPSLYPTLMADWFPADWFVNPGVSFRIGGYSATGKTAKSYNEATDTVGDVNANSKTRLLYIPLQVLGKVEVTPFTRKWVVFDVWAGLEYGSFQETRESQDTSSSTTTTTTTTTTTSSDGKVLTKKGTKMATSFGASANILVSWLDARATNSMNRTMGLGGIYLTPYVEVVRSMSKSGLTFGRSVFGLGFTFETYK